MLEVLNCVNQCLDFLWRHDRWQCSGRAGINQGRDQVRAFEDMAAKEGNALGSHPAFYPAAAQCFREIDQVLQNLLFRYVLWAYIAIIAEQIT